MQSHARLPASFKQGRLSLVVGMNINLMTAVNQGLRQAQVKVKVMPLRAAKARIQQSDFHSEPGEPSA